MKEFTCKKCGKHMIEEVINDMVQYSPIIDIFYEDGFLDFQYGDTHCEDGGACEIEYECAWCGAEVTEEELKELADET